jgi:hypothetical protein
VIQPVLVGKVRAVPQGGTGRRDFLLAGEDLLEGAVLQEAVLFFEVDDDVLVVLVIEVLHKTHTQDFLVLVAMGRDVLFIR